MKAARQYSIVVICQVYNELEKGNLKRFFKYIKPLADHVVVYDDASTDGSYEYSLSQTPHVIRGAKNSFTDEQFHKEQQLVMAQGLGADFILSMDADEVLTNGAAELLQKWCAYCVENKVDGVNLHKWNLWRSATYRRTDSFYDDGWFAQLWKVGEGLSFDNPKPGLHGRLIPPQVLKTVAAHDLACLHYGFADDRNIAYKYFTYKSHGQRGYLMLDRLIDESKLTLEPVPQSCFPTGLWQDEPAPSPRPLVASFEAIEPYKQAVRRPKYSIVCLIYKSVEWLEFSYEQVLKHTPLEDTEFFYVANNAEPAVLHYLRQHHIPHYDFKTSEAERTQWYINDVYRAWNYAAEKAQGDFLVFINSDMSFSEGWLENLIASHDGTNCVASRLVESGKLRTGKYGIERNFGRSIKEYKEEAFQEFAASIKENEMKEGGLYMPLFIRRDHFQSVGGYPEGNVKTGSDAFKPVIAQKGEELIPGDVILMEKLASKNVRHQTSWGSVVYHFQEGEMDEKLHAQDEGAADPIAIANDIVTGTMGERVLWDFLIEQVPGAYGLDQRLVGKKNFEQAARAYIAEKQPDTGLIIQNASFIGPIDGDRYTIAFLQDDLRKMGRDSVMQEKNLAAANLIVANSIQTAASYPEYEAEIISVGMDAELFRPQPQAPLRLKHKLPADARIGIFVGSFDEVKGWSKVAACIKEYKDIYWLCVTKHEQDEFSAANARVYKRIDQNLLVELLNCADFFIIGSPVETQCLAALEAALCDLPVLMPLTGIFEDFSDKERAQIGIFTDDLSKGVKDLQKLKLSPRKLILEKGLTVDAAMGQWNRLIARVRTEQRGLALRGERPKTVPKVHPGMIFRKVVIKRLIGREYFFPSTAKHAFLRVTYKTLVKLGLEPVIKRIRG